MNTHSHSVLARYLSGRYLSDIKPLYRRLFRIGCIQPDKNPISYLRGSTPSTPVQGHNWHMTRSHILNTTQKLRNQGIATATDFYNAGKLIHYLSDAFTYTHNHIFEGSIYEHRNYERKLHQVLTQHLYCVSTTVFKCGNTEAQIDSLHDQYLMPPHNMEKDVRAILSACCLVMESLFKTAQQVHRPLQVTAGET